MNVAMPGLYQLQSLTFTCSMDHIKLKLLTSKSFLVLVLLNLHESYWKVTR